VVDAGSSGSLKMSILDPNATEIRFSYRCNPWRGMLSFHSFA
jgi:hypothetical protein